MNYGVIGCGSVGAMRVRAIQQLPGSRVIAVSDADGEAATRVSRLAGGATVASISEVCAHPEIDAVVVATPVHLHEAHVSEALKNDKHVLCEKPLSNSVESGRAMVDLAAAQGKVLATGFNHRYYPSVQFAKDVLDRGIIGQLDHVRAFGGHDGLHNFRADWMFKGPISGGGAMMDVGIHVTDLCRFVGGDIAQVYGMSSNDTWNVEGSEDNAVAVFRTTADRAIRYQATWAEWTGYHFYVDVYGTKGMVRAYYAPMTNILVTRAADGRLKRSVRRYPSIIVREKFRGWETTAQEAFRQELVDFERSIAGESTPGATGLDGLRALEIADAVHRSTRERRAIDLDVG